MGRRPELDGSIIGRDHRRTSVRAENRRDAPRAVGEGRPDLPACFGLMYFDRGFLRENKKLAAVWWELHAVPCLTFKGWEQWRASLGAPDDRATFTAARHDA